MGVKQEVLRFILSMEFWRMAVLWTISLISSHLRLVMDGLFRDTSPRHPRCPLGTPTRPICIVTGATSGLGAAAAKSLSREGYCVILAGRSSYLLSKTIEDIKEKQEDACLKAFQVDLSSFQSIMNLKNSIEQWISDSNLHPSFQLLINNAGILATSYRVTAEGFDQMMMTNYIGPFALTILLLPLLKNSPSPARIVNVTSFTHRCVSNIQVDKDTLSGKNLGLISKMDGYPLARMYEYSKFCMLLFSYELHRQLCLMNPSHQISVMAADPGVVKTNIMREIPPFLSCMAFTVLKYMGLLKSPEIGIDSIIDAALAPPEASGLYFFGGNGRTLKSSIYSYDSKLAVKLWYNSIELLQEVEYFEDLML